jgi:hypothetical protein
MKTIGQPTAVHLDGPHAEYIRRLVDAAPPLNEAQRSRLATLFQPVISRPLTTRSAA